MAQLLQPVERPKGIPPHYRGIAWLSSGRQIYWTGRVAIGLQYEPPKQPDCHDWLRSLPAIV